MKTHAFGSIALLAALAASVMPASVLAARAEQNPRVTYVIRGAIAQYIAPAGATIGSVSLLVTGANRHAAELRGTTLTFAVTQRTRVSGASAGLTYGSRVIVKIRAPKHLSAGDLTTAVATQIVGAGGSAAPGKSSSSPGKQPASKPTPPAKRP